MWLLLASSLLTLLFLTPLSLFLLALTFISAMSGNILTPIGSLIIISIIAITLLRFKFRDKLIFRIITELILVIIAIGLTMHLIPGFNNLKVLDAAYVGPLSTTFTMYYNLDKAIIPFILLACISTLFKSKSTLPPKMWLWLVLTLSVPALLIFAVYIGGLRFETHHPEWLWQYVLANLFFVSLAEEALFRGYFQQRLGNFLSPYSSLIVASILFGALHYVGGPQLMLFAGLSGVIYGLAWMWSGCLWISTLFHFGLNLIHLLFFTYPLYQPLSL
ncbi:CPBP family intramembrane glutamic endopeptidase [Acerihabitans arboris]|uniref:CPBP family intramembrane metalloprotease n=1 Tax=Acerihabitans arboris TaxID=2691583 RepID=A0A845S9P4_9GAMM|nr:CPBP family intramembrane glutamic endopeptidase [Acerihabitans arboris]NDL61473.1 CPBP family intramembrane metalloprotease [Acerihabitans arboris]